MLCRVWQDKCKINAICGRRPSVQCQHQNKLATAGWEVVTVLPVKKFSVPITTVAKYVQVLCRMLLQKVWDWSEAWLAHNLDFSLWLATLLKSAKCWWWQYSQSTIFSFPSQVWLNLSSNCVESWQWRSEVWQKPGCLTICSLVLPVVTVLPVAVRPCPGCNFSFLAMTIGGVWSQILAQHL